MLLRKVFAAYEREGLIIEDAGTLAPSPRADPGLR